MEHAPWPSLTTHSVVFSVSPRGDAYDRPLGFDSGARIRTEPVPIRPGEFLWTDDTHMSLYLA